MKSLATAVLLTAIATMILGLALILHMQTKEGHGCPSQAQEEPLRPRALAGISRIG